MQRLPHFTAEAVLTVSMLFALNAHSAIEGLWLFEEGEPGADVVAVTNSVDPSKYSGSGMAVNAQNSQGWGHLPVYSSDRPGKYIYSDSTRSHLLSADAQSVRFYTDDPDCSTNGISSGGGISIPGLATRISELGSFTLEMFLKEDVALSRWCNIVYVNADQPWRFSIGGGGTSVCLQHDQSNMDKHRYFQVSAPIEDQWCHLAMVYDDESKTMEGYVNGTLRGTIYITNNVLSSANAVMLGCQSRLSMAMIGKVACVRLSGGTLDASAFLAASDVPPGVGAPGALAFYAFKDGSAGGSVGIVTNVFDAGRHAGTAAAFGSGGTLPDFVADAPGAYVYSSSACDTLLASAPQGIRFNGTDTSSVGSRIKLDSLLGTLYGCDEFTVEFFFKLEYPTAWRTPLSLPFSGYTFKCSVPAQAASVVEVQEEIYRINPHSALYYSKGSSFVDDTWHHMAVVWTNNIMRMFVDYDEYNGYVIQSNRVGTTASTAAVNLGCGSSGAYEAYRGLLSCVRATPRALSADEMLVASGDAPSSAAGTLFHWPCDGIDGDEVDVLSNTVSTACLRQGWVDVFECAPAPTFSSSIPSGRAFLYENGRRIRENTSCLRFAQADANGVSLRAARASSFGPGGEAYPESFTIEWFFRSEGSISNTVLLAGRGCVASSYDWRVGLAADGSLVLAGFRSAAEADGDPVSFTSVSESVNLADGRWHQAAVTYDCTTLEFKVFADYALVIETTLETSLVGTLPGGWFVGGGGGLANFSGYMDEVRLSSGVLEPTAFLRLQSPPGSLMLFR